MSNEQDAFENFDVDFDKVQRRRQQYLARKAAERGDPLLSGMDADGKDDDKPQQQTQQPQGRFAGIGKGLGFIAKSLNTATQQQQPNQPQNPNQQQRYDSGSDNRAAGTDAFSSGNLEGAGNVATDAYNAAANAARAASAELDKRKQEREEGVVGIFGGKKVVRWPYDDYHEVQKKYYQKLEEIDEAENKNDGDDPNSNSNGAPMNKRGSFFGFGFGDAANAANAVAKQQQNQAASNLQRPDDPPDIPNAVQGLPLNEFERKAEERAIGIVSTWLFDCGLIDELLVHGGMGKSTMRTAAKHYTNSNGINNNNNNNNGVDDTTTVSSATTTQTEKQGIEIGAFGHIIEGPSKMDKEIAKLRGGTSRQLTMVNSRLNDGVAASGGEVQELVNAVNSTKDDLGRLRELSTYIGGVGNGSVNGSVSVSINVNGNGKISSATNNNPMIPNDGNTVGGDEISLSTSGTSAVKNNMMARSQTFMLTKYPKLKKAINARRNLARCFRELDFYSQIPLTCDRLREDLHQAEWTDIEWSSLREVSREHVELEIFLVEAESGMKKRIEEEIRNGRGDGGEQGAAYGESATSRRSHLREAAAKGSNKGNTSSSSAMGKIQNYEEVDNFLHEHVKNVWELGDEIRMRIMSGIGGAFELATNNPAGLVALVEAVEVYETANEEYKSVHGEDIGKMGNNKSSSNQPKSYNKSSSNRAQNLRFTDMRASALKQMYQDFELRGLEVFREVHEVVSKSKAESSRIEFCLSYFFALSFL
jgi:hypothetical protein